MQKIVVATTVVALVATVRPSEAADPNASWAALASAAPTSPVAAASGDFSRSWTAPDGKTVALTIAAPHPSGSTVVTVPASAASGDATSAFATAIATARNDKAAILSIPQGTYTFKSIDKSGLGQLVLSGLSDMTIEGNNSTLVFDNNAVGVYVTESHRLMIRDLAVGYGFNTVSLGSMENLNGTTSLVVSQSSYPITSADGVGAIEEYDATNNRFVPNGVRIYQPASLRLSAADTYTSPSFPSADVGKTFAILHHYYGAVAIEVEDTPVDGTAQAADITLDNVDVQSGPGMGIVGYGYARGLLIENSSVAPVSGGLFSTEYDGIHLVLGGGDTAIESSTVAGTGDDAINAAAPVLPIVALDSSGTSLTLGPYSRFVMAGDTLAFFDPKGEPIATATVAAVTSRSYPNSVVTLSSAVSGVGSTDTVRDQSFSNDRLAVENNTITDCECHAMLVQTPDALVSGNTISDTAMGGIEALSNIGTFLEGAGAIDDLIENNTLSATGYDPSLAMPWSAINLYGAGPSGLVSTPIDFNVAVLDNQVENPSSTGCVTVETSSTVVVAGNTCTNTSPAAGNQPITVGSSDNVTMGSNAIGAD